jgi:quercetin dioxygenase-like cupin family protein
MDAIVLMPGEGEAIGTGSPARMKATAETTGGAFSLSETTFPANTSGPPRHAHQHTTDTFYVLEGALHVTVGDREVDLPAGGYALVPPGVVHTFSNTSDAPVRFLNLNSPGGWEDYLRDLAAAMSGGKMPEPAEFGKIAAKYDFVFPA